MNVTEQSRKMHCSYRHVSIQLARSIQKDAT